MLPQLHQFWKTYQDKLVNKGPYQAKIGSMKIKLLKLQKTNTKDQEIRAGKS